RAGRRRRRARGRLPEAGCLARAARPARGRRCGARVRGHAEALVLRERAPCPPADERHVVHAPLPGVRLHPADAPLAPAVRARARDANRLRAQAPRLKIAVLTTSYPRHEDDFAGRVVADQVERIRARRIDVEVVSPARFRHFGIAYGAGVTGNLRRRPYLALA